MRKKERKAVLLFLPFGTHVYSNDFDDLLCINARLFLWHKRKMKSF